MPDTASRSVALLRWVGFAEGVSCLALFGVAMPLKYLAGQPLAVRIAGAIHGGLFLLFLAVLAAVAIRRRWPLRRGAWGLAAAIIPGGTFVLDRRLREWDAGPAAPRA
jgi:integral membrane protein